jgi:NAD(P)-dependent dehydrogenase (short-subunit alcohol dehydrogenase family)
MRLKDKTALITGGARGIGLAFAEAYLKEGARVAIADVSGAEEAASKLGDKALGITMDVTDQASIDAGVTAVADWGGGIDILLNNAAIFDLAPIVDITRASYDKVFAVNVAGTLFPLQAVACKMIAQNDVTPGRGGKIINMASQAGRRGEALVGVYCASKAAVISLTQSAGLDLIRHGINVNGVAPGVIDTPMWDAVDALFARYEGKPPGQKKKEVGLAVPYGRMGRPSDMTGTAVFLASAEADYIVAQTFNVDGGNWMS